MSDFTVGSAVWISVLIKVLWA